ncbi:hypothetical protein B0A48_05329 [Cryoendolithus antarcticus]|uniref:Ubiquitin-like domain-containing protein n=1 Tax=Cryoendolithus antarcticus TaxID=1507870 RepID=A0A1V8TIF5_9PEZI|nr:hypothetical protein B0A48_05329 [Cryoendolithus antarcticus]
MADGETPAGDAPPAAEPMQLIFRDSNNTEITFKLKPTTKFAKAFDAFAKKTERKINELRFLYEGERLNADQTIEEIGMEDGDTVDVHMEQIGGYNYSAAVNEQIDAQSGSLDHEASTPDTSLVLHQQIGVLQNSMSEMRIRIAELEAKFDVSTARSDGCRATEDLHTAPVITRDVFPLADALQRDIFADVVSATPTRTLFISNIDSEVDDETFATWLGDDYRDNDYGTKIERYRETGVSKGYATLTFCSQDEAKSMFHELDNSMLGNQVVKVQYAMTRDEAVTARVRELKIEEEVNALPSLAELAQTDMQLAPLGPKITLTLKVGAADASPTRYTIRREQSLEKLFQHFEQRVGRQRIGMKFRRGAVYEALKGCYSATNYGLEDGDVIIAEYPPPSFRQSWDHYEPASAWCKLQD